MSVTIAWWWFPVAIVVVAICAASFVKNQGDYDFGAPFYRLAIVVAGIAAAIGIVVGKFI